MVTRRELDPALALCAVVRVAPGAQARPENEEVTLLYGGDRNPMLMNRTATEIVRMLASPRALNDVLSEFAGAYPQIPEPILGDDLLGLVDRLLRERYLVIVTDAPHT